jgi:uncharacterized membrane protein
MPGKSGETDPSSGDTTEMTVQVQNSTLSAAANGSTIDAQTSCPLPSPRSCPACGGENAHDAVFCLNPACGKALGGFRYVLEELKQELKWHEALAEKAVEFIGKPQFVPVHVIWFVVWMAINTGVLSFVHVFDEYPFVFLGIILAAEAIFISGFVLISNNRQTAHADKRAALDYEVSVRTYRSIQEINSVLTDLHGRMERLEGDLRDIRHHG